MEESDQKEFVNVHVPVLVDEVVDSLTSDLGERFGLLKKDLIFIDGTFGGGGYSYKLGTKLLSLDCKQFQILAGDLDELAVHGADEDKLNKFKIELTQANFADLIASCEDKSLSGIMLDLGFSTNQMNYGQRGFSYQDGGQALDLRFDATGGRSCSQKLMLVKDSEAIRRVVFRFSGEKFSNSIANQIFSIIQKVKKTKARDIELTVGQIVEAVEIAVPAKFKKNLNSILSRVWQALRIWTNDEFGSLEEVLPIALNKLMPGGRLAIVDFHSLEDKIVASFMRQASQLIETDKMGNRTQDYKLLTPRGIHPNESEISDNPSSRSATLRVLEKM